MSHRIVCGFLGGVVFLVEDCDVLVWGVVCDSSPAVEGLQRGYSLSRCCGQFKPDDIVDGVDRMLEAEGPGVILSAMVRQREEISILSLTNNGDILHTR